MQGGRFSVPNFVCLRWFRLFCGQAWNDRNHRTESTDSGARLLPQYTRMKIQIRGNFDLAVQQADVESKHKNTSKIQEYIQDA